MGNMENGAGWHSALICVNALLEQATQPEASLAPSSGDIVPGGRMPLRTTDESAYSDSVLYPAVVVEMPPLVGGGSVA